VPTDYVVARSEELQDGGRKVVEVGGTELGVFRVGEDLYAYSNYCAHRGGPVCQGMMTRRVVTVLDDDKRYVGDDYSDRVNVVCPWHGYEYDLRTGAHPAIDTVRLQSYQVWERDGDILVRL
jgi:nitrite reductase/ring-hydroxylating ferredoxin subunit